MAESPNKDSLIVDEGEGQPTIDVYQTGDEIVVQTPIAGVSKEDIDVEATSESVTIRGERHRNEKIEDADYLYQECFWGKFARTVILPQEVDPDEAKVSLKNGVLTVRLPKINRSNSKKLQIKED
ncbi:Hsp20/alpha crystallin family protein [Patescibacteria group bacterium]|nr:Hsp20/alpha crystallin family protein [Patescibacteria group bacterium]